MKHYISADDAVSVIKTGDRVYIQGVAATPHLLIDAMVRRADELRNIEIVHLHTEGSAPYTAPEYAESFFLNALFVGANTRKAIHEGRGDYVPVFLSEVPSLFTKGILPLDVALIHVSPPDQHGICSLGTSVDCTWAAVHAARHVIAQVNPHMPRTHGDGFIHVSQIDALVQVEDPLPESPEHCLSEEEKKIGWHCANLIEDGATLQMGIGAIPDAVLAALHNHVRLGIHTEMFSDGVIELVEKGVITGECKKVHPNKIVTGFVMGSRRLYDFVDDNPTVAFVDIGYVNRTDVIRRNPKVSAINSAIEVDLTGQICADSIGTYQFSGVGGQMDFIRGASLSEGGKPIIALPSITSKGISRIVPYLKEGAGVVTTRAHVHYIVTEYGAADLYGKNLRQRAKALIEIAHPNHRDELEKMAFERFKQL
ncbi:4-hydroxybutyrate CoA-transferase [bacterium (Candidatus Blackallbacteria) CG17_big_fil_post_rev_8_21_14_2_50_48_46]|uniref:4-hydroxybutyrate CoA-transferase n=1 Tax=bacterium (Candidatus Blackallbacteria) CG17_big_fil_post_rev_8_21_14_2_50_48_46 TaxID=2014261 RepID=A0A2M7G2B4_9BACT|nr:MAG: 4-hydroxybutyrate CoA-transferase [bacterium (Candidatus Blackallbacteria) CG18_big_fil_WC_8_21_14_2_50_49_26]PIW15938.1 MAG: 4-hydroxybutyrate CoA-transferase [bacterium (Candidatus Blackallbacteria) CG17_big_fil_post_rev_8_21_14_2_50_48_46]PIW50350.1 MAG: 4-hydroxybutyrate CoA-transferase [bacterium (Candidatus Blackallbacteria) CG13_big_fil_rev_8_21_14_2_50_49_14]